MKLILVLYLLIGIVITILVTVSSIKQLIDTNEFRYVLVSHFILSVILVLLLPVLYPLVFFIVFVLWLIEEEPVIDDVIDLFRSVRTLKIHRYIERYVNRSTQ